MAFLKIGDGSGDITANIHQVKYDAEDKHYRQFEEPGNSVSSLYKRAWNAPLF